MDVAALVAKAREQFEQAEPVDQDVLMGDEVVTVRFDPIDGQTFRALTMEHPPRPKVVTDQNLGYDIDAVVRWYPKVSLVQGDDVTRVSDPLPRKRATDPEHRPWFDVLDALEGPDLKTLASVVWGMCEYTPQKRLMRAGKASAGGRKKKPN